MASKAWMALLETHGGVTVEDNEIRLYGSTMETVDVLRLKFSRGAEAVLVPPSYDKDEDVHFELTDTTDRIEFDEVFLKWSEIATRKRFESDINADSTQTISSDWIFPWSELVGVIFEKRQRKQVMKLEPRAVEGEEEQDVEEEEQDAEVEARREDFGSDDE